MIKYRVISRTAFLTLIERWVFNDKSSAIEWARKEDAAGRVVAMEEFDDANTDAVKIVEWWRNG